MDDPRLTDEQSGILSTAAKLLWLNSSHEVQRKVLEHVTDNPEVVDVVMTGLIQLRLDRQAEATAQRKRQAEQN